MIPKIIIQLSKCYGLSDNHGKWASTWKLNNKKYNYLLFNRKDSFAFILEIYPEFVNLYNSLNDIEQTNLFKYLALHKYGGVYVDLDVICLKNIDPLLESYPNSLITNETESGQFIACPKGCPIMMSLVNEMNKRNSFILFKAIFYSRNYLDYYLSGSAIYTDILKKHSDDVIILGSSDNFYLRHKKDT